MADSDTESEPSDFQHLPETDESPLWIRKLTNNIFLLLLVAVKRVYLPGWMAWVVIGFESAQIVYFAFKEVFLWKNADWFMQILEIAHFETYLGVSDGAYMFVFAVLMLFLLYCASVGLAVLINSPLKVWAKYLPSVVSLFFGILYVPIITHLSSFTCICIASNNIYVSNLTCASAAGVLLRILVALALVIFIVMGALISFVSFEPNPLSGDITSRSNSVLNFVFFLLKTIIVLTYEITNRTSYVWIFIITYLVSCILLFTLFTWHPSYYSNKLNLARNIEISVWAWSSVCLIVTQAINDSNSSSSSILFFLGSPFVACVGYFLHFYRNGILSSTPASSITTIFDMDLKIRVLLSALVDEISEKNGDCGATDIQVEHSGLINEIDECFSYAAEKFPNSSHIMIYLAQYRFFVEKNKLLATSYLKKASERHPLFDSNFFIFRFRKFIDELNSGSEDVLSFIKYQKYQNDAKKHDFNASKLLVQFWNTLLEQYPDFNLLDSLGSQISQAINLAQESYEKMISVAGENPQPFRVYAGFLIDIVNDSWKSKQLLEKADEIETKRSTMTGADELSFLDERNALITVSGRPSDIGSILNVNSVCCKYLNYQPADIVGKNVSILAPEPYATEHEGYLEKYLSSGHSRVVSMRRIVLFRTRSSYLLPVNFIMKQVMDFQAGNVSFVGILKKFENPNAHFMIIHRSDELTFITSITSGLVKYFGNLKPRLPATAWIPEYESCFEMMLQPTGHNFNHATPAGNIVNFNIQVIQEANHKYIHIVALRVNSGSLDEEALLTDLDENSQDIVAPALTSKANKPTVTSLLQAGDLYDDSRSTGSEQFSQGSSGSMGSYFGVEQVQNMLRKMVGLGRKKKDDNLELLKNMLIGVIAIISVLALASFLLEQSQLKSYLNNLESIEVAGSRVNAIIETVFHSKSLDLVRRGILDSTWETAARGNLSMLILQLQNSQNSLYLTSDTLTSSSISLYTLPSVQIVELRYGSPAFRSVNLFDALDLFISQAAVVQKMSLESCDLTNSNYFYVVSNGMMDLLTVANTSSSMFELMENKSSVIYYTQCGFLIAAASVMFIAALCLFFPTVDHIEQNKLEVLKMFYNIPIPVIRALKSNCESRLNTTMEEDVLASKEGDLDSADTMHQDIESPNTPRKRNNSKDKRKQSREFQESGFWNNCCGRFLNSFRNSNNYMFYLKLGFFMGLSLLFFVYAFISSLNLTNSLRSYDSSLYWSSQRRSFLTWAHISLRDRVSLNYTSGSLQNYLALPSATTAVSQFQQLAWIDTVLIYGFFSENIQLTPLIKVSSALDALTFTSACGTWSSPGCTTFSNTIMTQGVHAATSQYSLIGSSFTLDLNRTFPDGVNSISNIQKLLSHTSMNFVSTLERFYLREAVEEARSLVYSYLKNLETNYISVSIAILVSSITVLAVYFFLVLIPLISELHENSFRTRSLLLMVPVEVIKEVRSIRTFMQNIVTRLNE